MNFYQILLSQKTGFNRNLTWYENLFAKFYNSAFGRLLAKFLKIKGNTIKFNQLVQNGNFANNRYWNTGASTFTVSNNEATITATAATENVSIQSGFSINDFSIGDKFYVVYEIYLNKSNRVETTLASVDWVANYIFSKNVNANEWTKISSIITITKNSSDLRFMTFPFKQTISEIGDAFKIRKVMVFNLTKMFDSGSEPSTVSDFETWLSNNIGLLPYYDYTPGTLISFNGTGLKTVGFNQWDEEWELGAINSNTGEDTPSITQIRSKSFIPILSDMQYYFYCGSLPSTVVAARFYDGNKKYIGSGQRGGTDFTTNSVFLPYANAKYMRFVMLGAYGTTYKNDICINISNTSKNGTYEPYTSSTLSLPISTYFPTGMKSAGTVYDEISDKAYTRVGSITLDGSENWNWSIPISGGYRYYVNIDDIATNISDSNVANVVCANYGTKPYNVSNNINNYPMVTGRYNVSQINFFVTSITSLNDWKTYLPNNPITVYYELATPTSQDISIDLSYEIEWGGTEQLLPENTSTPTTSAILADMHYPDGDRTDQRFVYREIEKTNMRNNRALSIILGRNVNVLNPEEPLNILLKGE